MLPDSEAHVRRAVILALGHRDPDRLKPLLSDSANDSEHVVRWAVITAAEALKERTVLCLAAHDPDSYVADLRSWQLIGWPAESPLDLQGSAVSAASLRRV